MKWDVNYFGRAEVIIAYQKAHTSGFPLSLSSEDNSEVRVVLLFFQHAFSSKQGILKKTIGF